MMAVVNMTLVSCSDDNSVEPEKNAQKETPQQPKNEKITVSPNYVPIKWEETEIFESNPEEGVFSFASTEETRKIEPGSVLVIDEGTSGQIVIVKEVDKDGDRVTVKTEQGGLCDIFSDCEFTLSSSSATVVTRYGGSGNVYTPTQVFVGGEEISGWLTRASSGGEPITQNIWKWEENYDNTTLYQNSYARIYLEEANFNAGLDLEMNLSFGDEDKTIAAENALRQYFSKALWMNAVIRGSVDINYIVRAVVEGNTSFESGNDDPWKEDIFRPITMKFLVGGVPVFVQLRADLFRGASLEFEGDVSCYYGARGSVDGSLGYEWRQSGGMTPIRKMDMEAELIYPTVAGKGKIEGKAWVYPRMYVMLYGIIGPSFDIKPYVGCSLTGGFQKRLLSSSDDYCAWQLKTYTGVDVSAGLDMKIFGPLEDHDDIGEFNVAEENLYESPTKIEFDKSDQDKVQAGVKTKVSFKVYDKNALAGKETLTPLPQIVKFEAPGTLSSKYGIAENGIVSVEWTPASRNDQLAAVLYDADGGVIGKAVWGEPAASLVNCPDDNHPHAIDFGLPSGTKWSCCNLGATKPEEYGNFYAWGETGGYTSKGEIEGSSDYSAYEMHDRLFDWAHYKWCNGSFYTLTKYCTQEGYGTVDGKTKLGLTDDAAHVSWGGNWRMPTEDEIKELIENTYFGYQPEIVNGVIGYKLSNKNNEDNYIFLPAAGYRGDEYIRYPGNYGRYWGSTVDKEGPHNAIALVFEAGGWTMSPPNYATLYRCNGQSIRPVFSDK